MVTEVEEEVEEEVAAATDAKVFELVVQVVERDTIFVYDSEIPPVEVVVATCLNVSLVDGNGRLKVNRHPSDEVVVMAAVV